MSDHQSAPIQAAPAQYLAPPYPLIRDGLRDGRIIPFLGAGASLGLRQPEATWDRDQNAYLPKGDELARHLAQRIGFPPGEPSDDLAKVCQYYSVIGGLNPLKAELHDIFDRDYSLTPLHTYLAGVTSSLLIVTTNYDDLIERALDAKDRAYDVVIHTTDPDLGDRVLWRKHTEHEPQRVSPNKLDLNLSSTTVIYKMHGAVDRREPKRDQYVITEDDYIDFLARMTKNKAIPAIFAEPFQTRPFLFLGYGLRDWNLRVVLNRVEKDLRRRKDIRSWSIQYHPSPLERRFWQERGVEVYDIPLEKFVTELADAGAKV